jgi:hypothetical protein
VAGAAGVLKLEKLSGDGTGYGVILEGVFDSPEEAEAALTEKGAVGE